MTIDRMRRALLRRLAAGWKRRKQKASDTGVEHCMQVARTMLRRCRYCFLITHGEDGWSSARFVEPMVDMDTLTIWVGTGARLRKVAEVRSNAKVTLGFGSHREMANLVVYGEARIETDLALRQRYWRAGWRMFFPDGPAGADYVLLRVEPIRMELMSFAATSYRSHSASSQPSSRWRLASGGPSSRAPDHDRRVAAGLPAPIRPMTTARAAPG